MVITDDGAGEGRAGAMWTAEQIDISTGFDVSMTFEMIHTAQFGEANGRSGMALVVQNSTPTPPIAAGFGEIGYSGIASSFAVEFDPIMNSGAGAPDHEAPIHNISVQACSPINSVQHACSLGSVLWDDGDSHSTNSVSGVNTARIVYLPADQLLEVFMNGELVLTITSFDAQTYLGGNSAWIGVVAVTPPLVPNNPMAWQAHHVINFDITTPRPLVIGLSGERTFSGSGSSSGGPLNLSGVNTWLRSLDCNEFETMFFDEQMVNNLGFGHVYNILSSRLRNFSRLQFALVGHSHGGGSVYDLSEKLKRDFGPTPDFDMFMTGYIDAIDNFDDAATACEDTLPALTAHHVNLYQRESFLLKGCSVPGSAPDLDVNTLSCVLNTKHAIIDDCEVVHAILTNRLRNLALGDAIVPSEDFCTAGLSCDGSN